VNPPALHRELRLLRVAFAAPAPCDEVGDPVVGPELVPQCQEIDVGVVALPDRVAGNLHLQAGGDRVPDGADL